jgi:hypothetical protein
VVLRVSENQLEISTSGLSLYGTVEIRNAYEFCFPLVALDVRDTVSIQNAIAQVITL